MPSGLIGAGLLGSALRDRLCAAGHTVIAYDAEPSRSAVASAAEVARACDPIFLSLPDSNVVADVVARMESDLPPGVVLIDTTTGDPAQAAALGARLAPRGIHYLDAEVAGSSRQARAGEALILCGGEADVFARSRPWLDCLSRRVFYLGPWGSGTRMKLVHNLLLGLHRAVLAEGLAFASALGLDPAAALEILRESPAASRVMDTKGRKMLTRDFTPEARLAQHLKDVDLILAAGARAAAHLPLSALHRELLDAARAAGFGDADNSAIIEAFSRASGSPRNPSA